MVSAQRGRRAGGRETFCLYPYFNVLDRVRLGPTVTRRHPLSMCGPMRVLRSRSAESTSSARPNGAGVIAIASGQWQSSVELAQVFAQAMVASLMTVPEHGIAEAATSNISSADTFSLAVKIAEVFAEQPKSAASR